MRPQSVVWVRPQSVAWVRFQVKGTGIRRAAAGAVVVPFAGHGDGEAEALGPPAGAGGTGHRAAPVAVTVCAGTGLCASFFTGAAASR